MEIGSQFLQHDNPYQDRILHCIPDTPIRGANESHDDLTLKKSFSNNIFCLKEKHNKHELFNPAFMVLYTIARAYTEEFD